MEKSYFIIVLFNSNPELFFVKDVYHLTFDSLTFMRSLARVFVDYDNAIRMAHLFESSGNFPSGTSFHVVVNSNFF